LNLFWCITHPTNSGKNRTTKIPQRVAKGSAAKLARGFVMHWETKGAKNIFHLNKNVNYIKLMYEGGSDINGT
jgi:hypothetical protein